MGVCTKVCFLPRFRLASSSKWEKRACKSQFVFISTSAILAPVCRTQGKLANSSPILVFATKHKMLTINRIYSVCLWADCLPDSAGAGWRAVYWPLMLVNAFLIPLSRIIAEFQCIGNHLCRFANSKAALICIWCAFCGRVCDKQLEKYLRRK